MIDFWKDEVSKSYLFRKVIVFIADRETERLEETKELLKNSFFYSAGDLF